MSLLDALFRPLPHAVIGGFALLVLWIAALLIVAVAAKDAWRLLRRALAMVGKVEAAEVTSAGDFATLVIDRIGRAGSASAARRAVIVLDRALQTERNDGSVRLSDGRTLRIPRDLGRLELWIDRDGSTRGDFSAAFAEASKIKGWLHQSRIRISHGAKVFIAGRIDAALGPLADGAIIVSTVDPRRIVWTRLAVCVVTMAGLLAFPVLVTWLSLRGPVDGALAIGGGVTGLAYFLIAQPLGVALRQFVTLPHAGLRTVVWAEPSASPVRSIA